MAGAFISVLKGRTRRRVAASAAVLCLVAVAWLGYALSQPFPAVLLTSPAPSVRVLDRHGQLLASVRTDGELSQNVSLDQLSDTVVPALLAAEDARFFSHLGVDPVAVLRAAAQALWHRKVVSGASTLTQQLARSTFDRPRTLAGKIQEIGIALRIEREWSKPQILEAYLNRIGFGPNITGIQAASLHYFDKPAWGLTLAEAAALVSIPRGPTLYDPTQNPKNVLLRRDRILRRMQSHGLANAADVERALAEPLQLHAPMIWPGSHHWVRELVKEHATDGTPQLHTTLDLNLQRRVEQLARSQARALQRYGAHASALVVVDNASGDVLAYVGSPDYFDAARGGQVDGARALRQPGSTLKPFVYATAMERLGYTAATLLPDIPLDLREGATSYSPRNYDGRYHGPVRLREALANSYNVPAVYTAATVGPENVLDTLHAVGFRSLDQSASHYGVALALGDGEVTLLELAAAYRTLARHGRYQPLRVLTDAADAADAVALDPRVSDILTDVLADPRARAAAFGRNGPLELPFDVAAKTGTSKGHRDNWTVGFTREITVAIWAGNFDGAPMLGASGVTGAGPLFNEVMREAMRDRSRAPLRLQDTATDLQPVEVCALSGQLATPECAAHVTEWFRPRYAPTEPDEIERAEWIDPANGLLAEAGCRGAERRVLEHYPPRFVSWALGARRPVAPTERSPHCSGKDGTSTDQAPVITYPAADSQFSILQHGVAAKQQIVLSAAGRASDRVTFVLDGKPLATVAAPFQLPWSLRPGAHRLVAVNAANQKSDEIAFRVSAR